MRTAILGLALALCAAAAMAQTAPVATAPVETAPAPGSSSVAEQIDAFIKASPVPDVTRDEAPGVTSSAGPADRKVHGMVELGVGTNGYRHAYGRADMPIGDTGSLSIAVDQTRFKGRFGPDAYPGADRPFGDSFSLGATGHAGDPHGGCRRPFDDPGEPIGPTPGACRILEHTGP